VGHRASLGTLPKRKIPNSPRDSNPDRPAYYSYIGATLYLRTLYEFQVMW